MKNLIILKIGGSVITDKFSKKPKVNFKNLKRIAKEIASAYNPKKISLIFIHGAGSYGHLIVKKTGIDKGIKNEKQLEAFAETQRLQNELNCIVTKYLINENLPAIPCQPSANAVMKSGRLIKMDISAIEGLLKIKMIPVLYGVPAYDKNQKCSILSGDQIIVFLAKKLKAKKIVHGTNVEGVFTGDPNLDPKAKLVPEINSKNINQIKKQLKGSTAIDVTGGMFYKVGRCVEFAKIGIKSSIISGLIRNRLKKALLGKKVRGTIIKY
ncbi:MAG: isopentenyl phosphate kinase [Candidatus Paceibacterales bacterium]